MLTYAIADLHGRHDLLKQAYRAIIAHAQGVPGTIVHLSDYIDRGPDSREVITFLMDPGRGPLPGNRSAFVGTMKTTCSPASRNAPIRSHGAR